MFVTAPANCLAHESVVSSDVIQTYVRAEIELQSLQMTYMKLEQIAF